MWHLAANFCSKLKSCFFSLQTEEGLPFLILFHAPDDNESIKEYTDIVQKELMEDKSNINFLVADGIKFAHPLHHLGKNYSITWTLDF